MNQFETETISKNCALSSLGLVSTEYIRNETLNWDEEINYYYKLINMVMHIKKQIEKIIFCLKTCQYQDSVLIHCPERY